MHIDEGYAVPEVHGMTKLKGYCDSCAPQGRMQRTYDYTLKVRLLRLFVPCQRVRCDSCGKEAWAWDAAWADVRQGEIPPAMLVVLCIIALCLAFYIAR